MKKIIATIISCIIALCTFSKDYKSLESLDSESLFQINLDSAKQLSYEIVESDYFQIRNTIKRYDGCGNKYYSLGLYECDKHIFEILQCTNGYATFTYLVAKDSKGFPRMLLIDWRVGSGGEVKVSFKINNGLIYLSYLEHCGEFPTNVQEIYHLDERFSVKKSHDALMEEDIVVEPK